MVRRETIHDPPVITGKGRPRTSRITGPLEGRARGGGAKSGVLSKRPRPTGTEHDGGNQPEGTQHKKSRRTYRCGVCGEEGHNRQNCPAGLN